MSSLSKVVISLIAYHAGVWLSGTSMGCLRYPWIVWKIYGTSDSIMACGNWNNLVNPVRSIQKVKPSTKILLAFDLRIWLKKYWQSWVALGFFFIQRWARRNRASLR